MTNIVTVTEMRAIEAAADKAGISYAQMMETAGQAVADHIVAKTEHNHPQSILVLVGPGNNGGDGLVAGRLLAEKPDFNVFFVLSTPRSDTNFEKVNALHLSLILAQDDAPTGYATLTQTVLNADVIIDALLGTGAALPLRGEIRQILKIVNEALLARTTTNTSSPRPYILAVDIPTGMDADTGQLDPAALYANETITFEAAKPGHYAYPGKSAVGDLVVAPLKLPVTLAERSAIKRTVVDVNMVRKLLPLRPPDANKGTFGKALIVAGSSNYIGAAALSAEASYRVGAGLVCVATPAPNIPILATHILEATWLPLPHERGNIDESGADTIWQALPDYTAALVGPGLGQAQSTSAAMDILFPDPDLLELHTDEKKSNQAQPTAPIVLPPLVVDADGLNILAKMEKWWTRLPARTILTPHAGEMARLSGIQSEGDLSAAQIVNSRRMQLVSEKAKLWNCVVVLKGAYTIVADPDGRTAVLPFANAALARAGTGDVLAGAIVGYLAQKLDPFEAAVTAAYVHGLAGGLAAEMIKTTASVLASDVVRALANAIHTLESTVASS